MTPIEALSDALYRSYVSGGTTAASRNPGTRDAFHRAAEQMLAHLEEAGWRVTQADAWEVLRDRLCADGRGFTVERLRQDLEGLEEGVYFASGRTIWQSDLGL